jgi:outer membrane protein OmpA-like peptidoglycan-associated protein
MAVTLHDIKIISEAGVGLGSVFGGFLWKIAPPEGSARVWTGLASLIGGVAFLSVALLVPMNGSPGMVHFWAIVAIASCGSGIVLAFHHILQRQQLTIRFARRRWIIGTQFTPSAVDYKAQNPGFTDKEILEDFGRVERVWTADSIQQARRTLGRTYALLMALIAFGLYLGAQLAFSPAPAPAKPADPPPTLAERAAGLRDVHFALNQSTLSGDAVQNLDDDAALLRNLSSQFPRMVVTVEGHCDDQGSERRNVELGFDRARAARQELIRAGVPESVLEVSSFGKNSPVCTGVTEACRQQNRRVHLAVSE